MKINQSKDLSIHLNNENNTKKGGSIKGVLLMLLSNLCFVISTTLFKEILVMSNLTIFHLMYLKGTFSVILCVIYALLFHINVFYISPNIISPLLLGRGLGGVIFMTFFFFTLQYMDYSILMIIQSSAPIYVAIIGYFYLSEHLSKYDTLGITLSFIGTILIFTTDQTEENHSYKPSFWIYFAALISVFAYAVCILAIRMIRKTDGTIETIKISLYATLFRSLFGSFQLELLSDSDSCNKWGISGEIWVLVILGIMSGWISQLTLIQALKTEKAGRAAIIDYSQVVFAYLVSIFYFKERIWLQDVCGGVLIVGSNLLIILFKAAQIIH